MAAARPTAPRRVEVPLPTQEELDTIAFAEADEAQGQEEEGEEDEAEVQAGGHEPEGPEDSGDEDEIENKQHFNKQSKDELLKSKASYERLVQEHKKKLDNYVRNPDAYDNKGLLRGIPEEIRKMRIEGRIRELQSQIRRQERDLRIINRLLKKI